VNSARFATVIRWIVVITMPFLMAVSTVLLLIYWDWPNYPTFEYRRIASDRYGLSDEERLQLAESTQAYLRRAEPAEEVRFLLEDLRLPGTDQPLYNVREVGHMLDVKRVTDAFKRVFWALGIIVIGGLIALLARGETRRDGYRALMQGGIFAAVVVVVVLILILVAWNLVFTEFHQLLFPAGSWTFAYTDSLIRLFPEQFWFDFGVIWTAGILLEAVILAAAGYLLLRRS
jgi:integral membrane protein (TIGR01906 family)